MTAAIEIKSLTKVGCPGDPQNLFALVEKLEDAFRCGDGCDMGLIESQP